MLRHATRNGSLCRFVHFAAIPGRLLAPAFIFGLTLLGIGCSDDDDDDNSTSQDTHSITIKEEHDWSFDVNDYTWNSPGPAAKVTLEIDDFHHGSMLVTIHDALGQIIFS